MNIFKIPFVLKSEKSLPSFYVKVKGIDGSIGPALMLDDRRALINYNGHVKILDLPSATVTQAIGGVCDGVNKCGLLDKDHVLVVSDERRHLKIMNLTTGELVKALKNDLVEGLIERLFVSHNGSTAVTFNDSGAAVVWNISINDCKVLTAVLHMFNNGTVIESFFSQTILKYQGQFAIFTAHPVQFSPSHSLKCWPIF